MAPLTDFITTVVNAFTPLIVPIGLLACVMGVILVMVGYNHGANFLTNVHPGDHHGFCRHGHRA